MWPRSHQDGIQPIQFRLRAGDVVLSGASGLMVPVQTAGAWAADIAPPGSVSITFTIKDHRQ